MVESAVSEAPSRSVTAPGRVSPAAHLAGRFAAADVTGPRAVRVREVPFLTMIGIRVAPGSAAAGHVEARLGLGLPARCGTVAAGADGSVLWQSPDEFLLVSEQPPAELAAALAGALADAPGAVVDLSANRTAFELSGPSAREVLEKGCPLDLHQRSFGTGTAYLTLVGPVPVVLWKLADERYRILPRSSFADFLGRWLLDAMAEFGAPEPH
jgi:sarcosine oxidase, subunit gamma